MPNTVKWVEIDPVREKLIELLAKYFDIGDSYAYNLTRVKSAFACGTMGFDDFEEFDEETVADIADYLITNGVTVPEWISVKDHNPKEPGEYTVARKHWIDGHLESKRGKWNGVEWFVDGRESLMVAYWMPPLPLPQPPKGE